MRTSPYIKKGAYDKRLAFLVKKWNELMEVQDTMSSDEVASDEFQAKRQRIGGLYKRANNEAMRERKDAVRWALQSVCPSRTNKMANLPTGIIGYNFN